jgi:hypothetical protein
VNQWQILHAPDKPELHKMAMRLNALGSLFFFSKIILKRDRLSNTLHRKIAKSLEREHLKLILEIPRDHLKTTLVTESLSMWWSLPFTEADEEAMRTLGYSDEWIRWMKISHDVNSRTLIVSENEPNAIRFGHRIDSHYQSNDVFLNLFPEIKPDASCTWNDRTKTQKRTATGIGEGTFDFIGVGGAVQSRHYKRIIQDDLFGRDAKNSELIANDTYEYHRLLSGVFDTEISAKQLGDEVVVGNRWKYYDLNGSIRENDKDHKWTYETHSAEGGCCDEHPPGIPIYFTSELLAEVKARNTWEDYAHQYLNLAVLPGEQPFQISWLRYYELYESKDRKAMIRHEVADGKAIGDINVNFLTRRMIVDVNHSEEQGRANHAIVVMGYDSGTDRQYLLDTWAKSTSYDELVANIYKLAKRWRITRFFLEKIAAQQLLRYPIEYRGRIENYKLTVDEMPASRARNAKDDRIRSLEPLFRASVLDTMPTKEGEKNKSKARFFCRRDQTQFIEEFRTYPSSRTVDILDCMGYAQLILDPLKFRDVVTAVSSYNSKRKQAMAAT